MRIIIAILIIVLLALQYKLWFGDDSIPQWIQLQYRLRQQEETNDRLLTRNNIIEAEVAELKSGEQSLEEQARFELGMIKKGEEYYQFTN